MIFSIAFSRLRGLLHKLSPNTSTHSLKPVGATLLIALLFIMGGLYGCGGGDSGGGPTAVLTAKQSPLVPGMMELDGRQSTAGKGKTIVSHTFTVTNQETGQIVYGPVTHYDHMDRGPIKVYPQIKTDAASNISGADKVTASATSVSGQYAASLTVEDETGNTATTVETFAMDAIIAAMSALSDATCSVIPDDSSLVVCTLSSNSDYADLVDNVMTKASDLNSAIDETTTMWMQAYGAGGGNGTNEVLGGDGGTGGKGGVAQIITSISDYESAFGTTAIYYYIGQTGSHDDSGGSGGASTMALAAVPNGSLEKDQIVLIAGGGGGAGEGSAFYSGSETGGDGGDGGFAYSDQGGESATGKGGDAYFDGIDTPSYGRGGGGTGCDEGVACGGDGYNDGNQGYGGRSGGSGDDEGSKGWINATPDIGDVGKGAEGDNPATCDGGGGGGGFGGGGGGTADGIASDHGNSYRCYGGGGGGSYAAASTKTDGDAPTSIEGYSDDGLVVIFFNTNPM